MFDHFAIHHASGIGRGHREDSSVVLIRIVRLSVDVLKPKPLLGPIRVRPNNVVEHVGGKAEHSRRSDVAVVISLE